MSALRRVLSPTAAPRRPTRIYGACRATPASGGHIGLTATVATSHHGACEEEDDDHADEGAEDPAEIEHVGVADVQAGRETSQPTTAPTSPRTIDASQGFGPVMPSGMSLGTSAGWPAVLERARVSEHEARFRRTRRADAGAVRDRHDRPARPRFRTCPCRLRRRRHRRIGAVGPAASGAVQPRQRLNPRLRRVRAASRHGRRIAVETGLVALLAALTVAAPARAVGGDGVVTRSGTTIHVDFGTAGQPRFAVRHDAEHDKDAAAGRTPAAR
jgi:hypothetical protein